MAEELITMSEERRQYERLGKSYRILYRHMDDITTMSVSQEGVVVDVGGGGLCFLASQPMETGSQLALVVEFTGWLTDGNGDWIVTHNDDDIARLEVIAVVTRYKVSATVPGRFEIGVRFCGRLG